jgi:hypothetical protein
MTTVTKNYAHQHLQSVSTTKQSAYDQLIKKLEFSHFSVISMAILIGSCLGGIAAMFVFQNGAPLWQFVLGLAFAMANLVACIAQAPTKWVVTLFLASLVVNSALLIINL